MAASHRSIFLCSFLLKKRSYCSQALPLKICVRNQQRLNAETLKRNGSRAYLADFAVASLQFQIQSFDIVCSPVWTSRDRCCDIPSRVSAAEGPAGWNRDNFCGADGLREESAQQLPFGWEPRNTNVCEFLSNHSPGQRLCNLPS